MRCMRRIRAHALMFTRPLDGYVPTPKWEQLSLTDRGSTQHCALPAMKEEAP